MSEIPSDEMDFVDPNNWTGIRDAAHLTGREPREIHGLCKDGAVQYQEMHDGAWLVHIPSLVQKLMETVGLDQRSAPVIGAGYAQLQATTRRLEKKIDTLIEGVSRMTSADQSIEADVASLRTAFQGISQLITTLQGTVKTLTDELAAAGVSLSPQTQADLDSVTSQILSLVPADTTSVPPADGSTTTPPATDPVTDPTDGGTSTTDPGTTGVDPTSGGATVTDPASTDPSATDPTSAADPSATDTPPATSASPQSP